MKVLELTGEPLFHGGQEKFIANLVQYMDDNEIVIDVLTPYTVENDFFCDLVRNKGGNVYNLGFEFRPGESRRFLQKELKDYLCSNDYDIVHIHSGSISFLAYASKAAKQAGIRKIIVHSHATGMNNLKHRIIRHAFGNMIRSSATDYLACSAEAGADKYPVSVLQNELVVISDGIEMNLFARNEEKRFAIRSELGIIGNEYVVGHTGRFSASKNHVFVIDVFIRLLKRIPESRLLLVGDGELREEIETIVCEKGIMDKVIMTGNVDNVEDYYQAMDLFIFPSLWEGFGYAALEAQAAGIPCLVSSKVPNTVIIGKHIKQLSLDNIEPWVNAAIAYRNKGVADNRNAIRKAGYDISTTINQIKEIYNS